MALSFVQYTGDGSTVTFAVPFPYIAQSHIQVKVDGVLKTASTDYTFPTSSTLQFTSAPLNNLIVEIRRVTPKTTRLVDFQDASTLTEATLDQDSNQNFFVAQESFDLADSNIKLAPDNTWDAEGIRIKNLGAPAVPTDAVRVQDLTEDAGSVQLRADLNDTVDVTKGAALVPTALRRIGTIANLRALPVPTSQVSTNVLGYYAPGDGGGGSFYWDAASTATDNGGTIILPTGYTGSGRWLRQGWNIMGDIDARWFGAKVDGSTDDTVKINAALATGQNVAIPKGTAVITAGLTVAGANLLKGAGQGSTTIQVNGNGYDAVTLSGSYSGVEDLTFTAPAARTSNAYVILSAATRGNFVRRVAMRNAFYGIHVAANAVITSFEDIEMTDTAATNGIGVFIAGGNDTFLTRIVMDASPTAQPMCGVRIKASQATWVVDCDMIHQGRGIQIDPDANVGDLITWCFFSNTACDLGTGDGLFVNPINGATVKGLFFDNCWFSSNANGVNLTKTGTSAVDGVYFTGCTMFNNQQRGFWNQAGTNVEVNDCRVSGNSTEASGTYAGLEFANDTMRFAVRGTRSGAVAGFPNSQSYGLLIGTGCDEYGLTDNNFYSNTTAGAEVLDNSAGSSLTREVRGNLGFKTMASGTATILNGANSVTVSHGLAGAPSVVLATPFNANLGGLSFWTGTVTATAFNINTSGNVTADSPFAWTASLYN